MIGFETDEEQLWCRLSTMFSDDTTLGEEISEEGLDSLHQRLFQTIAQQMDDRDRLRILPRLARAHEYARRRNVCRLRRQIKNLLGVLTGKYSAHDTWVYVPVGEFTWRVLDSFRRRERHRSVNVRDRSIVSRVIETRKVYSGAEMRRELGNWDGGPVGGPQIAGPVLVNGPGNGERCIGVVHMETNGALTAAQTKTLENDIQELAVPLLCLESMIQGDYSRWPYDPNLHGWCIESTLKRMCDEFTDAISLDARNRDLSTTLWHADWDCQRLWAQTTSGYNFSPTRRWISFDSCTGDTVAEAAPGKVTVASPDHPRFYSKHTSARIGVKHMLCCPIVKPQGGVRAVGSVNVYQFFREDTDGLPRKETLSQFARMLGSVIVNLEHQRQSSVTANLAWRMKRSAQLADGDVLVAAQFHVFKEALHDYFGAFGCSIFVPEQQRTKLINVASTGTRGDRFRYHEGMWVHAETQPSSYDLSVRGVIQYLYHNPGKSLVLNDVTRLHEIRRIVDLELPEEIVNGGLEHLTPDTTARRFLGIGIGMTGRNWMVIRLTRSMEQAAFTEFDAALLEHLASVCQLNDLWMPGRLLGRGDTTVRAGESAGANVGVVTSANLALTAKAAREDDYTDQAVS